MQATAPPPVHPSPQMILTPTTAAVARPTPGRPAGMSARGYRPSSAAFTPARPAGFAPVGTAREAPGPVYVSSPVGGGVPPGGFVFAMPPLPTRGLPEAVAPDDVPAGMPGMPTGTGRGAGMLPLPTGPHGPPLGPPGDAVDRPPVAAVPEPSSVVMLAVGVVIVAVLEVGRRRAGRE